VTGRTKVSEGCRHCYAERFAERWRGIPGHHYENMHDLHLRPERLELPLNWRRPARRLDGREWRESPPMANTGDGDLAQESLS
jgi:protein gp37